MPERHAQFAHGAVEIDSELVRELEDLSLSDLDHDQAVARMFAQDPLQPLDLQLVERGGGHPQAQRSGGAVGEPGEHGDRVSDEAEAGLVAAVGGFQPRSSKP